VSASGNEEGDGDILAADHLAILSRVWQLPKLLPCSHIVEVGESRPVALSQFPNQGMPAEQTAERTGMPLEIVQQIAAASNPRVRLKR
jgi:hypothetical protein